MIDQGIPLSLIDPARSFFDRKRAGFRQPAISQVPLVKFYF